MRLMDKMILKYFEFTIISILIKLKRLVEYRGNMYFSIFTSFVAIVTLSAFLLVFKDNFSEIFYWSKYEILFFSFYAYSIAFISSILAGGERLREYLLTGKFNVFLYRPINIFYQYLMEGVKPRAIINVIFYGSFVVFLFFFYLELNLKRLLLSFIFTIFTIIFSIIFMKTFDSFAFFMKDSVNYHDLAVNFSNFFLLFPFSFFKNFKFIYLVYIFPTIYYGSSVTDFLFGYSSFQDLIHMFYILLFLIFFSSLILYFIWKIGIKNYEAYG